MGKIEIIESWNLNDAVELDNPDKLVNYGLDKFKTWFKALPKDVFDRIKNYVVNTYSDEYLEDEGIDPFDFDPDEDPGFTFNYYADLEQFHDEVENQWTKDDMGKEAKFYVFKDIVESIPVIEIPDYLSPLFNETPESERSIYEEVEEYFKSIATEIFGC